MIKHDDPKQLRRERVRFGLQSPYREGSTAAGGQSENLSAHITAAHRRWGARTGSGVRLQTLKAQPLGNTFYFSKTSPPRTSLNSTTNQWPNVQIGEPLREFLFQNRQSVKHEDPNEAQHLWYHGSGESPLFTVLPKSTMGGLEGSTVPMGMI